MKKKVALILCALMVMFSVCATAATRATATPKVTATPKPTKTPTGFTYPLKGTVTAEEATLRQIAFSRGRIVDTLKKGAKVTINGEERANDGSLWYAVTASGQREGFLLADQVELTLPTPTPRVTATPKKATATPKPAQQTTSHVRGKVIGNINTKVYHRPTCRVLPNEENQVSFTSWQKAENEGYRACSICKP